MTPSETIALLYATVKALEEMSRDAAGRDALCPHLPKLTEATLGAMCVRNRIEARELANINTTRRGETV